MIVKTLPLFIVFSTLSLRFPFEVNHYPKKGWITCEMDFHVSLAFYEMQRDNVKHWLNFYAFSL